MAAQAGAQPSQQLAGPIHVIREQYQPEMITVQRVYLQDLKNSVKLMSEQEQETLKAPDSEMLLNMVMSQPELESTKKELTRNFDEVKNLS